jgi:hypothetical protein
MLHVPYQERMSSASLLLLFTEHVSVKYKLQELHYTLLEVKSSTGLHKYKRNVSTFYVLLKMAGVTCQKWHFWHYFDLLQEN